MSFEWYLSETWTAQRPGFVPIVNNQDAGNDAFHVLASMTNQQVATRTGEHRELGEAIVIAHKLDINEVLSRFKITRGLLRSRICCFKHV